MPWRLRKQLILIVLGCVALTLCILVLFQNASLSVELLGIVGILGGLAIIINSLPTNGNGKE